MFNKKELKNQIIALGIKPSDTLLIHSSMKAIGDVEGGADAVLDAFSEYLEKDGLMILPTHTWAQMSDEYNTFNPETEPSCVGLLTNIFRKREGVIRSLHPTHSLAAKGKDAEVFTEGEEKYDTPCNRKGCYGKLYDRNAKILLLGCTYNRNTFLHGVEEWNGIDIRIAPFQKQLKIVMPDGSLMDRPMFPHNSPGYDVADNYGKMDPLFLEKNIVQKGKFGEADCILCDAVGMTDLITSYLKKQPLIFSDNSPLIIE